MKLVCIAAVLQGRLYLFTAEFAIAIGIKALDQIGKKGWRCIGIQIAVGA
ncbi:hypothetical protein [Aeromonas sp. HMWF014]|nr:hypothetical protein [Aeromonas sp. HMWF014]